MARTGWAGRPIAVASARAMGYGSNGLPGRIGARVTYANVVSTLALFLAVGGGTAIALSGSNSVFSDDIAPHQVRSGDIAPGAVGSGKVEDGSLTGEDVSNASTLGRREIDEADLGTVPAATRADLAAQAVRADSAGGVTPRRIYFSRVDGDGASDPVLDLGGLVLTASCSVGGDLSVVATTTVDHATLESAWTDGSGFGKASDDNFETTEPSPPVISGNGEEAANPVQGTLTYTAPLAGGGRRVVNVVYGGDEGIGDPASATDCLFAGTAFEHDPPSPGG